MLYNPRMGASLSFLDCAAAVSAEMSFLGMSLIPRNLPLPIDAPPAPDNFQCNPLYGQNILPSSCQNLVDTHWPSGDTRITLYLDDPAPSNAIRLPFTKSDEWCTVSIEVAGPNTANRHTLAVSPNQLRASAGFLIQKCPVESVGIGGFVSLGIENVQNLVQYWGLHGTSMDQLESSVLGTGMCL